MNELPQNSILILEGKDFRVDITSLLPLNPVFEQCHSPNDMANIYQLEKYL